MDIIELKKYQHKIKKISIENTNNINESDYDTAMFKITLEKKSNEAIVFSEDVDLENVIPHKKKNNDYYLSIKNTYGMSVIYAHFLIADLYDYSDDETDSEFFVSYDLTKLKDKDASKAYHISDDEHPKITSILSESLGVNNEKDPNYKQYNMNPNLKGLFPIVSRYACGDNTKQIQVPNIEEDSSNVFTRDANSTVEDLPYWEARIPCKDIGDIIIPDTNEVQYPINVYLNYEYLPTSTEYHQHFFGFEGKDTTINKDINVFEGDNLNTVNGAFFDSVETDKYTYRLINWGDKYDHENAIFVNHEYGVQLDISNAHFDEEKCEWIQNECDDYYIYTPLTDENTEVSINVILKPDTSYSLKYYVYIPQDIDVDKIDTNVEIRYNNSNVIGTLKDEFKRDKNLLGQWIYHEIPFRTVQEQNTIHFKGHSDANKSIYFANVYIKEFTQYSPTIKYTNQGVFVTEENQIAKKENKDYNNYDNTYINVSCLTPQIISNNVPPVPYSNIYIDFDDIFDMNYNEYTTNLSYYEAYNHKLKYEDGCLYYYEDENDNEKYIIYNTEGNTEGELHYLYNPSKTFYYGTNNFFDIKIYADDNSRLDRGYAECAIIETQTAISDIKTNSAKYLGRRYCNANGEIKYTKLDFTQLPRKNNYNLQINYYHPCYKNAITVVKKINFAEKSLEMNVYVKTALNNSQKMTKANNIYTVQHPDEFPLEIQVHIIETNSTTNYNNGYCELSIDDVVKQTNYVNNEGVASFFLNKNADNLTDSQKIKLEYYDFDDIDGAGENIRTTTYYSSFVLKLAQNFNEKDPVPIRFNVLSNDNVKQSLNTLSIKTKDCLLIDIDTKSNNYVNYSIRLYKTEDGVRTYIPLTNNKTFYNVISTSNNNSLVVADNYINAQTKQYINPNFLQGNKTITYTIVTDSLIKTIATENDEEVITYSNNKYRQYEKTFEVTWDST